MTVTERPDGAVSIFESRKRAVAIAAELRRAARQSRQPVSIVTGGGGFKARRGDRLFIRMVIASFILFVGLPLAAASLYFGLLASKQYMTEARLSVRSSNQSLSDRIAGLTGLGGGRDYENSLILKNYILSRGMLDAVGASLDLRQMFSRPGTDWIAGANPRWSNEKLAKYWDWRVSASVDEQSGIVTVSTLAFTAEDSLAIMQKIVAVSEAFVNDLSARLKQDALATAERDLRMAEDGLTAKSAAMRQTREREGVLDASASSKTLDTITGALKLELARIEEQLSVSRESGVSELAPQMKVLISQRNSTAEQIASLERQSASPQASSPTLATQMQALDRAATEQKVAQDQYAKAVASYESARIDASSKSIYLVPFLPPKIAQSAQYPRRWWGWFIVVIPCLVLWLAGAGIAFLVRDHMAV